MFIILNKKTLEVFGENIKLARLRRKLSMEQIAKRAGISRSTLIKIEKGDDGVSLGSYFQVLFVMILMLVVMIIQREPVILTSQNSSYEAVQMLTKI